MKLSTRSATAVYKKKRSQLILAGHCTQRKAPVVTRKHRTLSRDNPRVSQHTSRFYARKLCLYYLHALTHAHPITRITLKSINFIL